MTLPLNISHLTKYYQTKRAVNKLSFNIQPGEVFGLLGPNGAGKTTTISMITTLEKPSSGKIEVFGLDISHFAKQAKYLMGVVPQELVNHSYFSVHDVMKIHSSYFGMHKNEKRIRYLLETLDLWSVRNDFVHHLSGGMKRRLLIAKALVHEPKLLLLDEPTAGVDIELRSQMWQFIRDFKNEGISVLLTTHYLEEAEKLCDRIGILHHGELKKLEKTTTLLEQMTHREILIILNEPFACEHHYLIEHNEKHLLFRVPRTFSLGDLLSEIRIPVGFIRDVEIRDGKLEDAFKLTLGESHA